MNDQLENIIKYLDNEMSKNERLDFENQIRKDEVLAKEVEFQRGLHGFLEREEPALEQKLSNLGDEFFVDQATKKRFFPYWIVALISLIVILVIAYIFVFNKNKSTLEDNQNPIEKEEIILPNEIEIETKEIIEEPGEEIEEPIKVPPSKPEKIIPENQPIAALDKKDYERNAIMEEVITETYRTNEEEDFMVVDVPKQDAVFEYSEQISFVASGSSKTYDKYELIVYSNRDFDIENDYRILDRKIDGELIEGRYQLNFNANFSLKKGLYYLIIRKGGTRDVLHISRFTVE